MQEFKIVFINYTNGSVRTEFKSFDGAFQAADYAFSACRKDEQVANIIPQKI